MTPVGVKYVSMYDSCRSQVSECMSLAGVMQVMMYDSCWSQVSQSMTPTVVKYIFMSVCMTPAGVQYLNALLLQESSISMHGSCRSQVYLDD